MTFTATSQDGLSDYVQTLGITYSQACLAQPELVHTVQIDAVRVRLRFGNPALASALLPALSHLLVASQDEPADITFHLMAGANTGVLLPQPPFAPDAYCRYGQRAIAYSGAMAVMHAAADGMLFAYDRLRRHGYFWAANAAELSIYDRAAPVQTLFHWALAEYGWQVIHAAAIGTDQGGVLLIGHTGAGKSTTALSCLAKDGLKFLCDDKCLMQLHPGARNFALFSSAKIKADMLDHLPHFRSMLAGWDAGFKAGKGLVFLHPTYSDHMVQSFPVKALLLPSVAHREFPRIQPAAAADAFRELGPSTVIWLPGAEADNYHFTAEITRRLPCYRLELALDPQRNADAIRELLADLA